MREIGVVGRRTCEVNGTGQNSDVTHVEPLRMSKSTCEDLMPSPWMYSTAVALRLDSLTSSYPGGSRLRIRVLGYRDIER